ncbi:MAG: glycosyltransferase [Thermodesulfobacteriota bacterium]
MPGNYEHFTIGGPLVSCLCVTRGRTKLLERAMGSFTDQTYPHKEIVVVYESDDEETRNFLSVRNDEGLIKVEAPSSPRLTLGELRNLAVAGCGGEYFCQWDDDDWSHRNRISFQMDVIRESGMQASILMHWLIFDDTRKIAYVSARRPWEGSLICKKSLIGEGLRYEARDRGEDTPLVTELFRRSQVFPIIMPKLYIYVYHGNNIWTNEHWRRIFTDSKRLSDESSLIIKNILQGKYTGVAASHMLDGIEE